jgi:hypothetical protein
MPADTTVTVKATEPVETQQEIIPDSTASPAMPLKDFSSMVAFVSSMETIAVPRQYVFIFIGMLLAGGLMIFIADSVQSRKNRKVKKSQRSDEPEQVVQDFKKQTAFEAFVITLFDPLYFGYRRPKGKRVLAGKTPAQHENDPDLEFEFDHKDTRVRFGIQCLYREDTGKKDIKLFPAERLQAYRHYQEENEIDLYYVLGIGGKPDDPNELYLIPAKLIRSEYVSREALKPYNKSGMFFYNSATQKLQ